MITWHMEPIYFAMWHHVICLKEHMTWWVGATQPKSSLAKLDTCRSNGSGDKVFFLSHDTMQPHD